MASEQWLFNDTSVASGADFAKVGSSVYSVYNNAGGTLTRTTASPTPYEGAGCYVNGTIGGINYFLRNNGGDTGEVLYLDAYFYIKSSTWSGGANPILMGDFGSGYFLAFSWGHITSSVVEYGTYDPTYGARYWNTVSYSTPLDTWIRCRVKTGPNHIREFGVFHGSNLNGSTPNIALTPIDFTPYLAPPDAIYLNETDNVNSLWIDNLKLDTAAYPTRSTAHTAAAAGTGTATGTVAMSNARTLQATATGTATGTAAASNQRTLAASASATASGTAAMSSTQAMSASGSVTASGTATGSIAAVVTISGSATITGTGTSTASVAMAQTATATGTVVATSSVDFIVIPPITLQSNGTVIADSSGEMAKTMPYESTGTATATSQAGATHTYYIFNPPTREIAPLSLDPYAELVGYYQGKTLVKRDGVWNLVQNKRQDWLDQCEYVFPGGRENRVNGTQKTELESAGYTVETRTS